MKKQADVLVQGGGSQYMFTPLSQKAKDWVRRHVQIEDWQWINSAFAVDHHYAENLAQGMKLSGLAVNR